MGSLAALSCGGGSEGSVVCVCDTLCWQPGANTLFLGFTIKRGGVKTETSQSS